MNQNVARGVNTYNNIEELKKNLIKDKKWRITNITRIRNDKGSLPLIRIFTEDPELVSSLITNGITIDFTRFKVEKFQFNGRSFPCFTCLQYHKIKIYTKMNLPVINGVKNHNSKIIPNRNITAVHVK